MYENCHWHFVFFPRKGLQHLIWACWSRGVQLQVSENESSAMFVLHSYLTPADFTNLFQTGGFQVLYTRQTQRERFFSFSQLESSNFQLVETEPTVGHTWLIILLKSEEKWQEKPTSCWGCPYSRDASKWVVLFSGVSWLTSTEAGSYLTFFFHLGNNSS